MYRYISPWCFFGPNQETKDIMEAIMKKTMAPVSKHNIEDVLISSGIIPHPPSAIAIRYKHWYLVRITKD